MPGTRILIVAGEASSDAHAAGLIRALRAQGWAGEAYGVGGPAMKAAGVALLAEYRDLAVVGFVEVLGRLPRILRLLHRLEQEIRHRPPDLFIPVDTPEFNLRLVPRAAAGNIPVVYFIAPQVWAWRPRRVRILQRCVRELLVLFPFEEPYFRERGVTTTYVGHPLVEASRASRASGSMGLLLPGSRAGEIRRHLPILVGAVRTLAARGQKLRWQLRAAPGIPDGFYARWITGTEITLTRDPVLDLATSAEVTVSASGTASFEAALAGNPLIVIYRVHPLTWAIARRLVRVPWVAMANLALQRAAVPELLQGDCTPRRIADAIERVLTDPAHAANMRRELAALHGCFGASGAYARAAGRVLAHLGSGRG
jgi:lipid-A-disaccharide synthase